MKTERTKLETRECRALDAGQEGLLTLEQLGRLGLTEWEVRKAVDQKLLRRLGPGIYERHAGRDAWKRGLQFATLWVPEGVISHQAAARIHQLEGNWLTPVEISATTWRAKRRGINLYRVSET